jgi:hypothetical protein
MLMVEILPEVLRLGLGVVVVEEGRIVRRRGSPGPQDDGRVNLRLVERCSYGRRALMTRLELLSVEAVCRPGITALVTERRHVLRRIKSFLPLTPISEVSLPLLVRVLMLPCPRFSLGLSVVAGLGRLRRRSRYLKK